LEPSRIVLVDLPRILRDIIGDALDEEPDMEVVGQLPANASLGRVVEQQEADFVIAGTDYGFDEISEVLVQHPRLQVLEVAGDGRESFLYHLRPARTPLGELSPRTIVDAIRGTRGTT
jgi:DNA-binding NarL/FixJ family response regulator